MKIGVLAVQGAFIEHEKMLKKLGADCVELRSKNDIKDLDGIVLPGGESTVQGKLLFELEMFFPLKDLIEKGIPVLATCAGSILLSEEISNDKNVYFGTLPVTIQRNAYGRQSGSFSCKGDVASFKDVEMTFIRAPFFEKINSNEVEVIAEVENKIVGVKYKNQIALAFHPELTSDTRLHEMFLKMIKEKK